MDFIFNELCFRNACPNIHSGKLSMINLLQVCKQGRELGMLRLAVRHDFYVQFLLAGYSINNWLNDQTVNKVLKDLLLSIVRQPYINNSDTLIEERFISSYAFLVDGETSAVEGLAIAYLYKTIAISLYSSEEWNVHEIDLKFSETGYDDQIVKVNHASQTTHVEQHKDWIVSNIGIKLPITKLHFSEKEINLRDDHGKNLLLGFSKKLIRSQFVTKVINSLPFNPHDKYFVRHCYKDGKIEIVLVRSDQGYGIIIQTTGRDLTETKAIAEVLNEEFHNEY
jgi:hypothetical protein